MKVILFLPKHYIVYQYVIRINLVNEAHDNKSITKDENELIDLTTKSILATKHMSATKSLRQKSPSQVTCHTSPLIVLYQRIDLVQVLFCGLILGRTFIYIQIVHI